jgi:hypothetical protein
MTRPTHLFVFALALTLLAGRTLRADVIKWDYSWSMSPGSGVLHADKPGKGKVIFDLEHPGSSADTSDISAANLSTVSKAGDAKPDRFLARGMYTLTLTLTDEASGLSGSVTFTGKINGTFTALSANLDNAFIGLRTKSLDLGNNVYLVTIGPYTPPGPPSSVNQGSIGAHVAVSEIAVRDAPEPSTFVLSCLGAAALLGLSARRWGLRFTPT